MDSTEHHIANPRGRLVNHQHNPLQQFLQSPHNFQEMNSPRRATNSLHEVMFSQQIEYQRALQYSHQPHNMNTHLQTTNLRDEWTSSQQTQLCEDLQCPRTCRAIHPLQQAGINAFAGMASREHTESPQPLQGSPQNLLPRLYQRYDYDIIQQTATQLRGSVTTSAQLTELQTIEQDHHEQLSQPSKKRSRSSDEDEVDVIYEELEAESGERTNDSPCENPTKRRKYTASRSRTERTELLPGQNRRACLNADGTYKIDESGNPVTARGRGLYVTKRMRRHEYLLWSLNWFGNNPHPVTKEELARECIAATRPDLKPGESLNEDRKRDRDAVLNLIHVHERGDVTLYMGDRKPAPNPLDERAQLKRRFDPTGKLAPWGTWSPGDPFSHRSNDMIEPPSADVAPTRSNGAGATFQAPLGTDDVNQSNSSSGSTGPRKRKLSDDSESSTNAKSRRGHEAATPSPTGIYEGYRPAVQQGLQHTRSNGLTGAKRKLSDDSSRDETFKRRKMNEHAPSSAWMSSSNVGYYHSGADVAGSSPFGLPAVPSQPTEGMSILDLYSLQSVENEAILSADKQLDENEAHMSPYMPVEENHAEAFSDPQSDENQTSTSSHALSDESQVDENQAEESWHTPSNVNRAVASPHAHESFHPAPHFPGQTSAGARTTSDAELDRIVQRVENGELADGFPYDIGGLDFGEVWMPPSPLIGPSNESRFQGGDNTVGSASYINPGSINGWDINDLFGIQDGDFQDQPFFSQDRPDLPNAETISDEQLDRLIEGLSREEIEHWIEKLQFRLNQQGENAVEHSPSTQPGSENPNIWHIDDDADVL